MAFTDNPTVQAMMQATGLDGQLASSGATPASPIGAVSSQNAPRSPQMRPEYQVARPPVNPRFAGPQAGGRAPITGVPGTEPGLMDAQTLQSPTVHDLLAHYGVSAPENINDHLFIHDPAAFAKHPMIANMIEQGLGGLANYHTGQDTASTISNIAGSVIGNQSMHAQAYNNRAMAPILQADQIGKLMENKQRMDQQAAQTGYEQAHQKWYEGQFENAGQLADARTGLINAQSELAHANARSKDNSPQGQLVSQWHQQVAALDPTGQGDETKVDPKVASDLWNKMNADFSKSTAAGKVAVQQVKNQGTLGAASMRANGKGGSANSKLDQGSAATDKDLVSGIKTAQSQYTFLDNLSKMHHGQRYIESRKPGNSKYGVSDISDDGIESAKQKLATHAGELHKQRANLYASRGMDYTGVQPDASAAPAAAPAAGNPFRPQQPTQ